MSGLRAHLSGRRGALRLDAEIAAPAGVVTALTGRSGSGKTTLLRALAGLERLDGRVEVAGAVWQDGSASLPPHRRATGMVFQHAALLPHLSAGANIRYGWRRARRSQAEFDRAVALTGAAPLLARAPATLSGGERQRVALARALACGPALLLLDEPLSGLDAAAKAELLPELRSVLGGLGVPVLYVTHDAAEVARIADRALHLRDGRLSEAPISAPGVALAEMPREALERLAAAALNAGLA